MLDAAQTVMRSRGLARATTKEIAREAGFSEAALYKHFADKTALFVAVLVERVPSRLSQLLHGLTDRAGRTDIEEVVTEVAVEAIAFYRETFPMGASLFSEPAVLAAHRTALEHLGTGPHVAVDAVAAYLAAEQDAGRVDAGIDARAAALLLLGACQMTAFLEAFAGAPPGNSADAATAAGVAHVAVHGLHPRTS
jgi:AcrR family transcriptional regulator